MMISMLKGGVVIVRLAGGLGNQIFQLGAALLIACKQDGKKVIIDDHALSFYKVSRKLELPVFIDFSKSCVQITTKRLLLTRLRLPKFFAFKSPSAFFVNDNNFRYAVDYEKSCNRMLDGYFQNLRQRDFEDIVALLQPLFYDRLIESKKINSEVCVVHIRGGDFIDLGWTETAPQQYYMNAMRAMRDIYKVKSFLVVTDDKKYAENIIGCDSFDIKIASNNMDEDFWILASHPKRILSASTFALWASALGKNDKEGVVIAPDDLIPGLKREFLLQNEINKSACDL
jgi:hypothetical protein